MQMKPEIGVHRLGKLARTGTGKETTKPFLIHRDLGQMPSEYVCIEVCLYVYISAHSSTKFHQFVTVSFLLRFSGMCVRLLSSMESFCNILLFTDKIHERYSNKSHCCQYHIKGIALQYTPDL
jgi:hypothetical protein